LGIVAAARTCTIACHETNPKPEHFASLINAQAIFAKTFYVLNGFHELVMEMMNALRDRSEVQG
jgi:hypothetical protein